MESLIHLAKVSVALFYTPLVLGICRNLFEVIFSSVS